MKKLLVIALIALSFVFVGCKDASITGGTVLVDEAIGRCKDSDGGINKDVQGVVSFEDEDYADECISVFLIEYYCEEDNVVNENIRCPDECRNGKCI